MKNKFINILNEINHIHGKLEIIKIITSVLQNLPDLYSFKPIDLIRLKFVRYSCRVLFFINCYNSEILNIFEVVEKKYNYKENLKIRINDDIYHYFDSLVTFTKSISEKNKIISPDLFENSSTKKYLKNLMLKWKNEIDNIGLTTIRDEIVHLNNYGMSFDSWCLTIPDKRIKLLSVLYNNDEKDLNEDYFKIYEFVKDIINEISDIYFSEYVLKYKLKNDCDYLIVDGKKILFNEFVIH